MSFNPTHVRIDTGEKVICTQWKKDGDHAKVERYPIEKRVWKGMLSVSPKEKYALQFGDWVIEDDKGRFYVVSEGGFKEDKYVQIEKYKAPAAPAVIALLIAILGFIFGEPGDLPIVFAVTHLMYYRALEGQWMGTANSVFDLDTDTINLSAHTNTYSPNQDTHDFFDDVTNEVTGTNYSAGGAAIGSKAVTRSTNTVTFDGADVVWSQSGAGFSNARKFVIRRVTGSAATERLYSVVTADADVGNVTGDLTIAWSGTGIATWTTT